jgi:hypothetical protein
LIWEFLQTPIYLTNDGRILDTFRISLILNVHLGSIKNKRGGITLTNIIDGMDEARFQSPNRNDNKLREKKAKEEEKKMPMVLRNLKNGS